MPRIGNSASALPGHRVQGQQYRRGRVIRPESFDITLVCVVHHDDVREPGEVRCDQLTSDPMRDVDPAVPRRRYRPLVRRFPDMIIRRPRAVDLDVQPGFSSPTTKSTFGHRGAADIAKTNEQDGRL